MSQFFLYTLQGRNHKKLSSQVNIANYKQDFIYEFHLGRKLTDHVAVGHSEEEGVGGPPA